MLMALAAGPALADHSAEHDAAADPPGLLERATDTLRALGLELGGEQPEFLPPDEAFVLSVAPGGPGEVVARYVVVTIVALLSHAAPRNTPVLPPLLIHSHTFPLMS